MEVLVLTQEHCAFCEQAKEMLGRLSPEYGFSVSVLDVASPEGEELAVRSGILFLPGILLNGEPISYGRPSERKLRHVFEQKRANVRDEG